MHVSQHGDKLVIRDTPGCLWFLGLWFVAGGTLALAMPFVAVNRADVPWWARGLAAALGVAVMSAGVLVIRAHPSTRTEIDRAAQRVRVTTRVPGGRASVVDLALSDVGLLQVLPGHDSDGDTHYSLRLLLNDGRPVPLHAQPAYGKDWVEARASLIRAYLERQDVDLTS